MRTRNLKAIGEAWDEMPGVTIPPGDVSEAVLFLASDASRYITGAQLRMHAGALLPLMTSGAPS